MSSSNSGDEGRQAFLQVRMQGSDATLDVRSATVEDHDMLIDKATIVFDDPQRRYTDFVREGAILTVDMGWMSQHAILFEGVIARVVNSAGGNRHQSTVTAYDLSYRLMQGDPKTRQFPPTSPASQEASTVTLSAILREIVGEYHLTVGDIQIDNEPQFTTTQPLRQTNKKDWQLIQEVAQRYGARAFVEHNDNASKFYFVSEGRFLQMESMGALRYCGGLGTFSQFRFERVASGAAAQRSVTTVDPTSGAVIPTPAVEPPTPDAPVRPDPQRSSARDEAAAQVAAAAIETPAAQRPCTVIGGATSDPALVERATRRDPTRILGLLGHGRTTGTIQLRAKGNVELLGVAPWADGKWYVKKVVHKVEHNAYATEFEATR